MGWIIQEYQGNVHIVPDTEPGHVLGPECFCTPAALMENEVGGLLVIHQDAIDREAPMETEDKDEDKPLFEPFQTETLDYGPSWGCIIALGLSGIAILVAVLILA
jgi:hypothetical protein